MPPKPVRVAIALSGGVDSAVAALLLKRCVPCWRDVEALWSSKYPVGLHEVFDALEQHRPWSEIVPLSPEAETIHDPSAAVHYFPLFMKNWEDIVEGDNRVGRRLGCEVAERDYNEATDVARMLGLLPKGEMLPLHNYSACYVEKCFQPMLKAYARGETLNVDILCNEEVKFFALLNTLIQTGRTDYLATGHYARTVFLPRLCGDEAVIPEKEMRVIARPFSARNDLNDQTLFLSRLSQKQILRSIFPLGHVFERKAEVRAVAAQFDMKHVSTKKTSTGLCFVGEHYRKLNRGDNRTDGGKSHGGFRSFLEEYIAPNSILLEKLMETGRQTAFINAETGDDVEASGLVVHGDDDDSPLLPAHSLTLGQLVRGKDDNGKPVRYYVQKKELFPLTEFEKSKRNQNQNPSADNDSDEGYIRYLRTVWLVNRWDHPLLYGKVAELRDVKLSLHPRWLGCEKGSVRLQCQCCARHQEPLRSAVLCFAWNDVYETDASIHLSGATVIFDEPVRAITPGQALVAYCSLEKKNVGDAAGWFVLASGWIVSGGT